MKKESTRPLLVGIVERWRALEQRAFRESQAADTLTKQLALADWATASRELTQAETLLWLADQQWGREERAALLLESHHALQSGELATAPPAPIPSKPAAEK